jgi:hypothetical protein
MLMVLVSTCAASSPDAMAWHRISGDLSAAVDSAHSEEALMIPASCLTLSVDRDRAEAPYGVQCMLHSHDTVTSVTVSRLCFDKDTIDVGMLEVQPHFHRSSTLVLC